MISKVKSIQDVEAFFKHLLENESLNFHPDDDFRNYIHMETKLPSYSIEEAEFRNKLMKDCFNVCKREGTDIYEIGSLQLFNNLNF
ncbi:hypothetical protein A33Q_2744 [Indibacter alkaliphilus LW1]|uniref:Uncharacterized protein n=1 Tax=Indibacter alkaliphilus (strain CCUG 57479 / KCTC 22604 / LW1) TaxID=1189612 RepID=S2DVR5_INDAL|nr:hypothetical protein [Indibacter alkaliphilus]EOZ96151.1 hypothetical protein A33Q_2744 [Indibacter alkaliphilus LW1]